MHRGTFLNAPASAGTIIAKFAPRPAANPERQTIAGSWFKPLLQPALLFILVAAFTSYIAVLIVWESQEFGGETVGINRGKAQLDALSRKGYKILEHIESEAYRVTVTRLETPRRCRGCSDRLVWPRS